MQMGGDLRLGIFDMDGKGEVVGGIVVMRYGENALSVIDNVKARLEDVKASLPAGTEVQTVYDRSNLINRAIETLKGTLLEESLIVAAVCVIFLLHWGKYWNTHRKYLMIHPREVCNCHMLLH